MPTASQRKTARMVRETAEAMRKDGWEWPGLPPVDGKRVTRLGANLFLLGCMIDGQQGANRAWWQAQRFVMSIVPAKRRETLWDWIVEAHTKGVWSRRKTKYGLHYLQAWHDEVYTYAQRIVELFDGDPRQIWRNPPADVEPISHVRSALRVLGLGPARARMCVGALRDHGLVQGATPFKEDVHVSRLMHRLGLAGSEDSEDVLEAGRRFFGPNSWAVDWALFRLGQEGHESRVKFVRYYKKYVQPRATPLTAGQLRSLRRKFSSLVKRGAQVCPKGLPEGGWRTKVSAEESNVGFYLWPTKGPLAGDLGGDYSWIWVGASLDKAGHVELVTEIAANIRGRLVRTSRTRDALYRAGYSSGFDGSSTEYFWKDLGTYPPAKAISVSPDRVVARLVEGGNEAMQRLEGGR